MAMTKLALSQQKLMWCLERQRPHTMQVKIIGTSSFAIIPILYHSAGHRHCTQWTPNTAAQPHEPEASVWA